MFQVAGQITKVETTSDKGVRITFISQEIPAEAKKALFDLWQKYGYFMFNETEFKEEDLFTNI